MACVNAGVLSQRCPSDILSRGEGGRNSFFYPITYIAAWQSWLAIDMVIFEMGNRTIRFAFCGDMLYCILFEKVCVVGSVLAAIFYLRHSLFAFYSGIYLHVF